MSEAIKGQDELKLAVEKLEAEIFKDWPTKIIGLQIDAGGPLYVNRSLNLAIHDEYGPICVQHIIPRPSCENCKPAYDRSITATEGIVLESGDLTLCSVHDNKVI